MKNTFAVIFAKIKEYKANLRDLLELRRISNSRDYNADELIQRIKLHRQFRPSQKDSEIKILLDLIHERSLSTIVEIGGYKGGSLFLFSQASNTDGLLISIDIEYTLMRQLAYKLFSKTGQRIICIKGNSQSSNTARKLKNALSGRKIDLLFIDGDHSFLGVMNDYVRYSTMVKKGGIIAFHDINPDNMMRHGIKTSSYVGGVPIFWRALVESGAKTTEIIDDNNQDGYGLGIVFT